MQKKRKKKEKREKFTIQKFTTQYHKLFTIQSYYFFMENATGDVCKLIDKLHIMNFNLCLILKIRQVSKIQDLERIKKGLTVIMLR